MAELDLVGGAVEIARALKPRPDMRILSLMMGASLPALASGPYLAMLTGAECLPLGVFSLSALWAAMADGKAVSIVAPARSSRPCRRRACWTTRRWSRWCCCIRRARRRSSARPAGACSTCGPTARTV